MVACQQHNVHRAQGLHQDSVKAAHVLAYKEWWSSDSGKCSICETEWHVCTGQITGCTEC